MNKLFRTTIALSAISLSLSAFAFSQKLTIMYAPNHRSYYIPLTVINHAGRALFMSEKMTGNVTNSVGNSWRCKGIGYNATTGRYKHAGAFNDRYTIPVDDDAPDNVGGSVFRNLFRWRIASGGQNTCVISLRFAPLSAEYPVYATLTTSTHTSNGVVNVVGTLNDSGRPVDNAVFSVTPAGATITITRPD